jgi:hypothetical protein
MNFLQERKIESQRESLQEVQRQITEVSTDRKVIIAKIIQSNTIRPSIDVRGIVASFYDAASRANVHLKGFSIKNDVINTTLIAKYPDGTIHPDAASTILKMMREYSSGAPTAFRLDPIKTISGTQEVRTTNITLRVNTLAP